ncbi:MAG TPA: SRPBCC family protein [Actinomycetes bacterium]|nr:SRPBCC family protein [Actinomycetes bacterium]
MRIEQTVEVDAPLDRVWALVNDVPRVAPCMPGAALTKVVDERTYEGTVRVKLGPISMSYKGTVVLEEVDEAAHSAQLSASGKEVRGGGTARAKVDTRLEAVSDTKTRMSVVSDVQLTGKVASFGRGAISDVSAKLFGQFADCLRETLEAETRAAATAAAGPAEPAPAAAEATPAQATPAAAQATPAAAEPGAEAAPAATAPSATVSPPAAPLSPAPTPAASRPLKVGGLIGTVVIGRLKAIWAALAGFVRRLLRRG